LAYPVKQRFEADWGGNTLTLVNFWATWCLPCKQEMPLLEEMYQRHKDRGFTIVGAFERWETAEVPEYMNEVSVSYTIIRPDAIVDHYWGGISIKPTSFLVDRDGRILRKYVGAKPEQTAGLAADVQAVLDGQPMPTQVVPPPLVSGSRSGRRHGKRGLTRRVRTVEFRVVGGAHERT
jgi:thiol-disulfide isomerase/thioredoxin